MARHRRKPHKNKNTCFSNLPSTLYIDISQILLLSESTIKEQILLKVENIDVLSQKKQYIKTTIKLTTTDSENLKNSYRTLIVIQHNGAFSSVYGSNDKSQINQEDSIVGEQTTVEMGNYANNQPVLHFKTGHWDKTVDPLAYLPK